MRPELQAVASARLPRPQALAPGDFPLPGPTGPEQGGWKGGHDRGGGLERCLHPHSVSQGSPFPR